jgi:hypothetical protein
VTINAGLAALLLWIGSAYSQEPPPTGGVATQPQRDRPATSKISPADNEQRTSQPPVIVNVLPTPKTEEEVAAERRERNETAALNRKLVDWTAQLACFTAGLLIATVLLFGATVALGVFAYRQFRAMMASIAIAKDANELNRENMIASRRAWLSISDVKLRHPTKITEDHITFSITVMVENLGQTPAINVVVRFESYFFGSNSEKFPDAENRFKSKLRSQPPDFGHHLIFPKSSLIQGETWTNGVEKIQASISERPSGEKMIEFIIFIGVSYRIVGDETAHVTYRAHGMLNVPIGFAVPSEGLVDLPSMPFLPGEAD